MTKVEYVARALARANGRESDWQQYIYTARDAIHAIQAFYQEYPQPITISESTGLNIKAFISERRAND